MKWIIPTILAMFLCAGISGAQLIGPGGGGGGGGGSCSGDINAACSQVSGLSHVTNGSLASSGLANTAVSAGSYTATNLTVNAQGQITAASNGAAGATAYATVTALASTTPTGTCSATSGTHQSRDLIKGTLTGNTTYTTPTAATGCIDGDIIEAHFIQADNQSYTVSIADGAGTTHVGNIYTEPTSNGVGQGRFLHFCWQYNVATTQWHLGCNYTNPLTPVQIAEGGTGTTSTLTGLVRGNAAAMTAAELSGDATTSGSNAVTVLKTPCTDFWAPGAIAQTFTAGHTYCPNAVGTYTFAAAANVNVNNVTIKCSNRGMVLQRTGATDLFDFSGNNDQIQGCTLDGNSQSGSGTGPLVKMSGTDDAALDNQIQNPGATNTTTGNFVITDGAARARVLRNHWLGTIADQVIAINPASSGTTGVADAQIVGNQIDACAFTTGVVQGCIITNDNTGASPVTGLLISSNTLRWSGDSAYGIAIDGGNISPTSATHGARVVHNFVFETARGNIDIRAFGFGYGNIIANNLIDDNSQTSVSAFAFGDLYDSIVSGNEVINNSNAQGSIISCADCGHNIFVQNRITSTRLVGIYVNSQGGTGSSATNQNIITENIVNILATVAADCYRLDTAASGVTSNNSIIANQCTGDGTAGQIGIHLMDTSGTDSNPLVSGNIIFTVPTGITIASGVTGSTIQGNQFATVTTNVSNSSTDAATKIGDTNTYSGYGTTLSTSATTNYFPVTGIATISATENAMAQTISRGGQFRNLFCFFTAAQGSAKSDAITVDVTHNGTPSASSVTCTATNAQTCSDTTHVGTYVAGDQLDFKDVTTGSSITARSGSCGLEVDQGQQP